MKKYFVSSVLACIFAAAPAHAQFTLSPLVGFGGSDGWVSTNEYYGASALDGTGNQRALAYGNAHVYLQTGTAALPQVKILNPNTGAEVGSLNMTGVSGGARLLSGLGVGGDGAIYGCNLQTALSGANLFKVYRWATEASTPTLVYSGNPLTGARLGDSFDVSGSGSSTRAGAGFAATPAIAGNNGYAIIDTTGGTHTQVTFSGTPPAAGDFRLGIAFGGSTSVVLGDQGNAANDTRLTSYSGGAGTLTATLTLSSASERQMDYTVLGGVPLLATIETGSGATTGTVRVYDMSNPLAPLLLGSLKNQTGTVTPNGNGTGGAAWGDAYYDSGLWKAPLYAMNSNNGLEAFLVAIPEPTSAGLALLGGAMLLARSIRRKAN